MLACVLDDVEKQVAFEVQTASETVFTVDTE
eukprot:COSAG03_NODE_380_length_8364_cov_20.212099_10_plen_31_part_00